MTLKKSKSKTKPSTKPDAPKEFVPRQKKEYYVSPKEFTEELQNYYQSNIITDKLALMIKNIAYGLAHAPNFINYTFKEDAIGDSLINMFNALKEKKYKFDRGANPFSYFNSISFNCWRSRIKKEKRMRDTLAAYQEEVYSVIGPGVGVDDPVNPKKNENY